MIEQVEISFIWLKKEKSEAKLEVDKKAKDMLVMTMQKYASDVTNETNSFSY